MTWNDLYIDRRRQKISTVTLLQTDSTPLGRPKSTQVDLLDPTRRSRIGGWPLGYESEGAGLIDRTISFQDFQLTYVVPIHQRHRRTNRRHAITIPRFALVHRAVKSKKQVYLLCPESPVAMDSG